MSEELKEFRVSNEAMKDPDELQRRIDDDGYLFFKRLQNPDKLRELRLEMMTTTKKAGWLLSDTDPYEGITDVSKRCTEGDTGYPLGYGEVYKLESFHRQCHWPELVEMSERILGQPVIPNPHLVARIWFPQFTEHTTPRHQDFAHFQGSFRVLSCWTPLGDCSIELGGLALIPGSHKVGRVLEHHFALGAGYLDIDIAAQEEVEDNWYLTNYEMGDTLFFPALTIHKALPNITEDKMRLSLDNRYFAVGDPIPDHMQEPHPPSGLNWEQVCANWSSDEFKYFWKDFDFPTVPRDLSFSENSFAEALELAKEGDERAFLQLRRKISNLPDSPEAGAARDVLAEVGGPV